LRGNNTPTFQSIVLLSIFLAGGGGSYSLVPRPIISADTEGWIVADRQHRLRASFFDHTRDSLAERERLLIAAGMARGNGLIEPSAELYDPHASKFVAWQGS